MIIVYPAHLPERAAALVPQALCAKGLAALRHMSTGPVLWHLGLLRGLIGKMTHGIKPAVQGKGRVFMAGTLYLVATPIGNLDDMTPRAAATFASADFVAAEDTRVTLKLLNHLGLKKPMVSYYDHNLKERGEMILARIEAGESCALCSDAGMPAISDPGEVIVRDAHARGIRVVPVPGASAADTALIASGQCTGRFVFEGFLPTNRRQKRERLAALQAEQRTVIFYEAPHKLPATLADLEEAFGPCRPLTICRELTKLHEEICKTTIGEANAYYKQNAPRGEFVLVMAGARPTPQQAAPTLAQAAARAQALVQAQGMTLSAAAKQAAAGTPFSKSEVYRACLDGTAQEGGAE